MTKGIKIRSVEIRSVEFNGQTVIVPVTVLEDGPIPKPKYSGPKQQWPAAFRSVSAVKPGPAKGK